MLNEVFLFVWSKGVSTGSPYGEINNIIPIVSWYLVISTFNVSECKLEHSHSFKCARKHKFT